MVLESGVSGRLRVSGQRGVGSLLGEGFVRLGVSILLQRADLLHPMAVEWAAVSGVLVIVFAACRERIQSIDVQAGGFALVCPIERK